MKWLICLVLVAGCAKEIVHARYPATPDQPTGTLVLKMSRAASDIAVAINGLLVVDDAHTEKIVIENVPVGTREIVMSANGADKAFSVWIGSEHPTTVPLGVPEESTGFLKSLFGSLVTLLAYSLLN